MRIIRAADVSSFYPSLMVVNGYTSRNIPSAQIFADVYHKRLAAKKAGDKKTSNALKLVLNTTYGGTLNRYNDLYDPLQARSVCISGQLYLLQLAQHLYKDIPGLKVIQCNTDAVMAEFDEQYYDQFKAICNEWQERTHFGLQQDVVKAIYQGNVNNYIEVQGDGSVKAKGGYLVRGIATAGAWKVNNNACVVAKAIREYFLNETSAEDTINAETDIFQFQQIAKAGSMYRQAYCIVDGQKVPVQKVNRVYATTDERYGRLYKVKAETDGEAKIDSLPEHCLIDNEGTATIDQIDRQFYIDMAKKRINDFLGIKPQKIRKEKKTMVATKATTPEVISNVYTKLMAARMDFLQADREKSGKNLHLKFKYYELDDIVPVAMPIFAKYNLIPIVSFTNEFASMKIVNMENPADEIIFQSPIRELDGNAAINALQGIGACHTYFRRYLYMIALDVCQPDQVEANLSTPDNNKVAEAVKEIKAELTAPKTPAPAQTQSASTPAPEKKQTIPMTAEKREEIKQELTQPAANADALQMTSLKNALKEYIAKDPDNARAWGASIAVKTKGFTQMSKTDWEACMKELQEKKGALNG